MDAGTLFDDATAGDRPGAPLAARMRPRTLDEVLGQSEALGPGRRCGAWLPAMIRPAVPPGRR